MRRLRFATKPGWLALHAITVVLVVTMVLLGRWQLTVSERKGFNIQNFGYALQWWAFSSFVLLMWARAMRDALRGSAATSGYPEAPAEPTFLGRPEVAYRRYVMPTEPARPSDPVHAAYNDYLAALAEQDSDSA